MAEITRLRSALTNANATIEANTEENRALQSQVEEVKDELRRAQESEVSDTDSDTSELTEEEQRELLVAYISKSEEQSIENFRLRNTLDAWAPLLDAGIAVHCRFSERAKQDYVEGRYVDVRGVSNQAAIESGI